MKNLENIYVYMEDAEKGQRHFELCFMFHNAEEDKYYDYTIEMSEGMHLDDFRNMMKLMSEAMNKEEPELCRGYY